MHKSKMETISNETLFENLIIGFIENKVGVVENFLPLELAKALKNNLLGLYSEQHLRPAGIGNNDKLMHNKKLRSDVIYWLDRSHENPIENQFLDFIDAFVNYLNRTCYTGITGYEFHYALYEKGSFYTRHLDQFKDNKSRQFSMIMYLNEDWQEGDGGELCIYQGNDSQTISPLFGKCVFFKSSELEHEVLLSNVPRLSVTGWLRIN